MRGGLAVAALGVVFGDTCLHSLGFHLPRGLR